MHFKTFSSLTGLVLAAVLDKTTKQELGLEIHVDRDSLNDIAMAAINEIRDDFSPELVALCREVVYSADSPRHGNVTFAGRPGVSGWLKERGFETRQINGLIDCLIGERKPVTSNDMKALFADAEFIWKLSRTPNVGIQSIRSVLHRCIAHGWIPYGLPRVTADEYLGGLEFAAAKASAQASIDADFKPNADQQSYIAHCEDQYNARKRDDETMKDYYERLTRQHV